MIWRSMEPSGVSVAESLHPLEYARPAPLAPKPWPRIACVIVLLLAVVGAIVYGLRLRYDIWHDTIGVHFAGDVSNGYQWGRIANARGIFNLFDEVERGKDFPSSLSQLDYTPLRLAVVTAWNRWAVHHYPGADYWRDDYAFTAPMLWMNNLSELAASAFVFLLVRLWTVRMKGPGFWRGVIPGLIGAMLFWFNPAILWDGHCWPQWDVWLLPWFLAALYLACVDWWFAAGVCLAIGASLKGQLLLGAPILVLWPLFAGKFDALLRLLAGAAFCTAAIALPWMNLNSAGITWFILAVGSLAALTPILLRWNLKWYWLAGLVVVAMLLAWPWQSDASIGYRMTCVAALGVLALACFLPARLIPSVHALAIAGALFLAAPLFNGSSSWFTRGFLYGSERYSTMVSGTGTNNLPKMLMAYFRWPQNIRTPASLPAWNEPVTFRTQMTVIYGACVVLCAIGAGFHERRRDTRFLIAMAAPWVLFYVLLPQMHGRYLVWGAGMCALLAGTGMGMTLLGIIISFIGFLAMVHNQYTFTPSWDPVHYRYLASINPHLGWMLLLAAAILLYNAALPRTRWTST